MDVERLTRFDAHWPATLRELADEMHPVDRDACFIWFQFFPLGLDQLLRAVPDRSTLEGFYQLRGTYRLAEVADTSHWFLYGHRYWLQVKQALRELTQGSLADLIRSTSAKVNGPPPLTLAISAAGLMTLRQVGAGFLESAYTPPMETRSAEEVLAERASDRQRAWFSKRTKRVVINERQPDGWFPLLPGQHITTAAESDKRSHHLANPRCSPGNGPIPVDCRSGTCGTCWVGVLGGNENLSPVEDFERKRMEYFGYWESEFHHSADARPLIRLACQCVAQGSCSIIIPPWNGVWSKSRRAAFARRT